MFIVTFIRVFAEFFRVVVVIPDGITDSKTLK
ncbi:MAG: hypothetical protein PWQ32_1696, partial [Thermococcaceae archaeon]|nr:hypothetical protein [Thermococcaceae archaeon]